MLFTVLAVQPTWFSYAQPISLSRLVQYAYRKAPFTPFQLSVTSPCHLVPQVLERQEWPASRTPSHCQHQMIAKCSFRSEGAKNAMADGALTDGNVWVSATQRLRGPPLHPPNLGRPPDASPLCRERLPNCSSIRSPLTRQNRASRESRFLFSASGAGRQKYVRTRKCAPGSGAHSCILGFPKGTDTCLPPATQLSEGWPV